MHRVSILVLPGVILLDLTVPMQIFGPWPVQLLDGGIRNPYTTTLAGPRGHAPLSGGLAVSRIRPLRDLSEADTIVVPGCEDPLTPVSAAVLTALADAGRRGARIVSICTGAFILADAGLLDGRRATTHWRWAAELQRLHPRVDVQDEPLYIDDGQVLTSAGVLAGTDLCLHVLRRDCDQRTANALARYLVSPPHRDGGQAQYIARPLPMPDGSLADMRAWLLLHLDEEHTLTALARRASVSVRTLTRHFQQETGQTIVAWLTAQRIAAAQERLEGTDDPVATIAQRLGFGSVESLRQHFQHALGTSPQAYRRTFRVPPPR